MAFSWQVVRQGQERVISFKGALNESAVDSLSRLAQEELDGSEWIFDLGAVSHINSLGIRCWVQFMRQFSEDKRVTFRSCTQEIINQIGIIPSFLGNSSVESFYGLYICPACDHCDQIEYHTDAGYEAIIEQHKGVRCSQCHSPTDMEADEDTYFDFLRSGK